MAVRQRWETGLGYGDEYFPLALVSHPGGMILSFGTKATEQIWAGELAKRIPGPIQEVARRKLRMLNNTQDIMDLRMPPANRLEKLKGGRKEHWSIRTTDQRRVIFRWQNGNALEVEIIGYH
jgi:proteic killer suppression protein